MAGTAERTNPELWERVKQEVAHGDKGGSPDQWSARKAQLAVSEYKKRGGGYTGKRTGANHLVQWTRQDWGTKLGKPSGETHERYLPKKARESLSDQEYARTTAKKRADSAKGQQFSRQPKDITDKVASARRSAGGRTKAALMAQARQQNIAGRSRMNKDELERALHA